MKEKEEIALNHKGLTQEHTEKWIALYQEGWSIRAIAAAYQVNKAVVSRALKLHVDLRPKSPWEKYGEEWLKLYQSGMTKAEISRHYQVTAVTVGKILELMGIEKVPHYQKYAHLAEEFIERYQSGESLHEIGERFHLSPQLIWNYLKRNGVETRSYAESSRIIPFHEDYFETLQEENVFILGMLFQLGNLVYDGSTPRLFRISSIHQDLIAWIQEKLGRKRGEEIQLREGRYFYDEIHSQRFISRIKELGFHGHNHYSFSAIPTPLLDRFLDGYFFVLVKKSTNPLEINFIFPTNREKEQALTYFAQKNLFTREEVREKQENAFILGRKTSLAKVRAYYLKQLG